MPSKASTPCRLYVFSVQSTFACQHAGFEIKPGVPGIEQFTGPPQGY